MKDQISNSKSQTPNTKEAPSLKPQTSNGAGLFRKQTRPGGTLLELVIWNFSGVGGLEWGYLPRSRWDMRHSKCSTEYFPLTLTLSLREREQQASDWCLADGPLATSGTGVIQSWWTILPLPRGEGRLPAATAACLRRRRRQAAQAGGEGERSVTHPTVRSV